MLPRPAGRAQPAVVRRPIAPAFGRMHPPNVTSEVPAAQRALVTWMVLVVACGVVIALGYVWLRIRVFDLGYRLATTRQIIERLEQEGRALTVEIAALSAPGRIETEARTRLGMDRPAPGQGFVLP